MNAETIEVIKQRIAQLVPQDEPLYAAMKEAERLQKESELTKKVKEASDAWVNMTTELHTLQKMLKTYEAAAAPVPTEATCQS